MFIVHCVRKGAYLVEMAGVEPASENSSAKPSTGVAVHLKFPLCNAGRQALHSGSPVIHDRLRDAGLFTFTAA